ncbi:MAG: hypothetical protein IPJ19_02345 [Planctomycetes bacterium]|nr:hypothetical protein [Planctomycetota bacterium]
MKIAFPTGDDSKPPMTMETTTDTSVVMLLLGKDDPAFVEAKKPEPEPK